MKIKYHRLRIIASEYVDLIEKEELAYHPEKRKAEKTANELKTPAKRGSMEDE